MDNYDPNNWSDNNNTNQNQNINGNQHPNQNYFNNDYPVPPAKPKDKLATFSLILAIAGCVTSIVYYISLPCTISAIVLAILSRSRIGRFEGKAVAGLCLGISGIVLMLFFFARDISVCCNSHTIQIQILIKYILASTKSISRIKVEYNINTSIAFGWCKFSACGNASSIGYNGISCGRHQHTGHGISLTRL